jgi:hypothetical protein
VPWFNLIAESLHELTGKNVPYVWRDEQEQAFQTLKNILCSEPVLQYPDFERKFIVTCGAGSNGSGEVFKSRNYW